MNGDRYRCTNAGDRSVHYRVPILLAAAGGATSRRFRRGHRLIRMAQVEWYTGRPLKGRVMPLRLAGCKALTVPLEAAPRGGRSLPRGRAWALVLWADPVDLAKQA